MKYLSRPFGALQEKLLKISATRLLIKICVITGWALYEDPKSATILKEQFELKLKESYRQVNEDEMEYAFRSNTTVKDWGKYMNLAMMDEVMMPYLNQRLELSEIEEQKVIIKELPAPADDLSDEDFIEANKSVYALTKNFGLIHPRCYDLLVKDKKIVLTEEQKEEIKKAARAMFFGADNLQYATQLSHGEQERLILLDCKKIAVAEWFNCSVV